MRHEVTTRRVLYEIPGMRSVRVRKAEFAGADGEPLPMAIYEPITPPTDPPPVVVLLEGYPDSGIEKHLGCRFMDMEWTISMAQLIAASGLMAITHSNRDPEADGHALVRDLAAKGHRVGIWSTSGHGPVALAVSANAACAVMINPITKDFCPDTPLFMTRSGKDETPGLNAALDRLVAVALSNDRPITLVNYPEAPHSFDLFLDGPETRRILQQGLDFLRANLG